MKKYLIIILLTTTGACLQAQSLRDYLIEAAENNPGLQAAFDEFLAAQEKAPQAAGLPDPELTFGYFIEPMELPMGARRADLSLMQMFPWFGTLQAAGDEASQMAKARFLAFQEEKNQLFYEVKNTWYELYRLEQEIRLVEENLEILKSYERMAMVRFRSGGTGGPQPGDGMSGKPSSGRDGQNRNGGTMEGMGNSSSTGKERSSAPAPMPSGGMQSGGGMVDVLRAQMDIKEMENSLTGLRNAQKPLEARFNALLNRPADKPTAIADTLIAVENAPETMILPDSAIENNPMVSMFEAERLAYDARQKMAKKEGLPMFGVGVNYMIMGPVSSPETQMQLGGKNMAMPMVTITLPIYRKKYNSAAKEAELRQKIAKNKQIQATNELAVSWRETLKDLEDAERELRLYREQEALAGQALRLLTTSYASEGADFEEILRARRQLIDYRIKLINAVADQHTAIARLEWLKASEL